MQKIARALSSVKSSRYRHCFIARLIYSQLTSQPVEEAAAQLITRGTRIDKIMVTATDKSGAVCAELEASIMFGRGGNVAKTVLPADAVKWRVFAATAVKCFAADAGDINEIHFTDYPVVPGLLILAQLRYDFGATKINIKFIAPVYAGEVIYLSKTPLGVDGYAAERCIFKAEGRFL